MADEQDRSRDLASEVEGLLGRQGVHAAGHSDDERELIVDVAGRQYKITIELLPEGGA